MRKIARRWIWRVLMVGLAPLALFVVSANVLAAPPQEPRATHPEALNYAVLALRDGDRHEAGRWLRRVSSSSPHYGFAMRMLGYRVLTCGAKRPRAAVPFVNRAVLADPFDGNAWQDLARVYARALRGS